MEPPKQGPVIPQTAERGAAGMGRYSECLKVREECITPRLQQPCHRGLNTSRSGRGVNKLQCRSLERTLCPHSAARSRECQLLS